MTCDSLDEEFVVHREGTGEPNTIFRMHECGLHCCDPREEQAVFACTVAGNKLGFTVRQTKGAEKAVTLCKTLAHPSPADCRWAVQNNQIKHCPTTVDDTKVAITMFGKDVNALEGKTTRKNMIHVAEDFTEIPKELLDLHKEVFLTADVFFANKAPFFLTASRKM